MSKNIKSNNTDVAIIGAGIVGIAHAWAAAKKGQKVTVFEKNKKPLGATARNFGTIWPIGAPTPESYKTALRSREIWQEIIEEAGLWVNRSGAVFAGIEKDECRVLEEFAELGGELGYEVELLNKKQLKKLVPAINTQNVKTGLLSKKEMVLDPTEVTLKLPVFLREKYGIEFRFQSAITQITPTAIYNSQGERWSVKKIIICGGADFQNLFHNIYANSGIKLCKLQMMRTVAQPTKWQIGPALASGHSLRFYKTFSVCPSIEKLKTLAQKKHPDIVKYGIHIMMTQNPNGEIAIGDSHEYDDVITPFDSAEINRIIIEEAKRYFILKDWSINQTWHGICAFNKNGEDIVKEVMPNVHIVTAFGTMGMTMSFGQAEKVWNSWLGEDASAKADNNKTEKNSKKDSVVLN